MKRKLKKQSRKSYSWIPMTLFVRGYGLILFFSKNSKINSFIMLSYNETLSLLSIFFGIIFILSFVILVSSTKISKVYALSSLSSALACVHLLLDAPDVALTEASIGACISTVIFVIFVTKLDSSDSLLSSDIPVNLNSTSKDPLLLVRKGYNKQLTRTILSIICSCSILVLFAYLENLLPEFGNESNPINSMSAKYYLENTQKEIGIPTFVSAILASYRGFDTFGETLVILISGIGVCLILGIKDEKTL